MDAMKFVHTREALRELWDEWSIKPGHISFGEKEYGEVAPSKKNRPVFVGNFEGGAYQRVQAHHTPTSVRIIHLYNKPKKLRN
jgi:hypothetical protein